MQIKDLEILLDSLEYKGKKIPNVYHSFKLNGNEVPSLPYIVYFVDSVDTIGADNKVAYKENRYIIELYTKINNTSLEEQIEKLFDDNNIFYEKFEAYIQNEGMFQIAYHI